MLNDHQLIHSYFTESSSLEKTSSLRDALPKAGFAFTSRASSVRRFELIKTFGIRNSHRPNVEFRHVQSATTQATRQWTMHESLQTPTQLNPTAHTETPNPTLLLSITDSVEQRQSDAGSGFERVSTSRIR